MEQSVGMNCKDVGMEFRECHFKLLYFTLVILKCANSTHPSQLQMYLTQKGKWSFCITPS